MTRRLITIPILKLRDRIIKNDMEPKVAVATNTPQPQIKDDQLRNTDSGRIIKETSRKSKSFQR
jgi:hypothetical protein